MESKGDRNNRAEAKRMAQYGGKEYKAGDGTPKAPVVRSTVGKTRIVSSFPTGTGNASRPV